MKWMDMGPYPVCNVGLITSKRDWMKSQKEYGFEDEPWPNDVGYSFWVNTDPDDPFVVVIFQRIEDLPRHEAIGLIAHEAVHVWQFICEHIRAGKSTGREIEAYSIQWIVTWIAKELRL